MYVVNIEKSSAHSDRNFHYESVKKQFRSIISRSAPLGSRPQVLAEPAINTFGVRIYTSWSYYYATNQVSNSAARWRSQRAAARATTRSNLSPGRCSRSHTATRPQASRLARSSAARARCLTALGTRSVSPRRSASRDHALARKRGCKSAHRLATLRYTDKLHITPRVGSRPRFFADARCNV